MTLNPRPGYLIALATGLIAIGAGALDQQPVSATQQFSCNGRMNNGWSYTAEFLNGRFTQIRWQRSGQPPQTSTLTYKTNNTKGQPIYTGSFQGATRVSLVDISAGNVQSGSQVSVQVEEWGSSVGTCGAATADNQPPAPPPPGSKLFCDGRMNNDWTYTAEFSERRFTQILWQRPGQPPQVTTLTLKTINPKGIPIYTGAFQSATTVTLVDLSGGNPRVGSEISVGVEEWGWARGRCRR
ncbi:MAG: hypothetical protein KGQ93_05830 [Cyanobacteria bacterium REEB459]|nr:hypothetical protein [Cyanobacteria bacterium REEB459]